MSDSRCRGFNFQLTELMKTIGYPVEKGVCYGYSKMWRRALLNNEAANFISLVKEIETNDKIKEHIENVRAKVLSGQALTAADKRVFDYIAFFDGIMLYQNPRPYSDLFGNTFIQGDDEATSSLILSEAEKNRGIAEIFCETAILTPEELENYLTDIAALIDNNINHSTGNPPLIDIAFKNYTHAISLYYDTQKKQWRLIDANLLGRINESFTSKEIANVLTTDVFPVINLSTIENVIKNIKHEFNNDLKEMLEKFKSDLNAEKAKQNILDRLNSNDQPKKQIARGHIGFNLRLFVSNDTKQELTHLQQALNNFKSSHKITSDMLNRKAESGVTLAFLSVAKDDVSMVKKLAENNVDLSQSIEDDHSAVVIGADSLNSYLPLNVAVSRNNLEIVDIIIKNQRKLGKTVDMNPLILIAINSSFYEMVKRLAKLEAQLDISYDNFQSPVCIAAMRHDIRMIKLLAELGANLSQPLSIAIVNNNWQAVTMILASIDSAETEKFDVSSLSNIFSGSKREAITIEFIHILRNTDNNFIELAQDVIDGKNALGKVLNSHRIPFTSFFSERTYQNRTVTESIWKIIEALEKRKACIDIEKKPTRQLSPEKNQW